MTHRRARRLATAPGRSAALAGVLAAALLGAAACGDGTDDAGDPSPSAETTTAAPTPTPDDSGSPDPATSAADPTGSPGSTGSPSAEPSDDPPGDATDGATDGAGQPDTVVAPIYFVGRTPTGLRLYREFREVEADNPAAEALALMAAGDALDPDYDTLYPAGSFGDVRIGSAGITVAADPGWAERPAGMSRRDARLAVQQLVYTVQGVAQTRAPVAVEGGSLLGVPAKDLRNAPELRIRALVNISAPGEGDRVTGTLRVSGVASSYEANVPWELRDGDGDVVRRGFATAEGWLEGLFPWETRVRLGALAPGDYTFVARTDDPEGGGRQTEDSRTVTVG